jgi:hypothetical protein
MSGRRENNVRKTNANIILITELRRERHLENIKLKLGFTQLNVKKRTGLT